MQHDEDAERVIDIGIRPIRRRRDENRSANTLWHFNTTGKLIKFKFIVSGVIAGYSRKLTWSKCSSTNETETVWDLFLKAAQEHATPLQVRDNVISENRLLANNMMFLRNASHNGHIGGRSIHITRRKDFWSECNTTVEDHV